MSVDEKRIREFAYQIWESEGKPEGQEERHWDMARKLAEAEALAWCTGFAGRVLTLAALWPLLEEVCGMIWELTG